MIVVSDTTPLNYLVLIGAVEILPRLLGQVFAPPSVLDELLHPRAPEVVRRWAQTPPVWLSIQQPRLRLAATDRLDRGEADAIALAKELNAVIVLIDERRGAAIATRENLTVVRTLAVLEAAAASNLVDLKQAITKLSATTFRFPPRYLHPVLPDQIPKDRP